ncbi:MAG: 2,3-bisphosphoglycerate-independent phosphoglycerate mutase [Candidatus Caldarchaeum sp.]|nr:2,3-bisphosphoglycerate-independent phosphoglycerate mutase [Candidatus Caldarchaeum sp.]MDW8436058.1 2,3-bisphosphoglycerate-independent phosphoglycerate mutase [Candidatus Caldarchaeum sp.]
MKAVLVVLDGLGDRRCRSLNWMTPLQAARSPFLDRLAAMGETGLIDVVAPGLPNGSDTGHLALLGYDPFKWYTGRGPFEALGAGLTLTDTDVAFRCNFATVSADGAVLDRRAGRISSEESRVLAEAIPPMHFDGVEIIFKHTVEHRGVLIMRGDGLSHKVSNVDPHGRETKVLKPKPLDESTEANRTAQLLQQYLEKTRQILENHPVNLKRKQNGLPPANYILTRGAGRLPNLPSFREKYGLSAAVVAGGALYKGVCRAAGFEVVNVEGATGTVNTNLNNKAAAVVESLKRHDFVLLHIKATDTLSHDKKPRDKAEMIRKIDAVLEKMYESLPPDTHIAVTGDHSTPSEIGDHRGDPVPVLIYGPQVRGDDVKYFDEISCAKGGIGRIRGTDLMTIIANYVGALELFGE